MRKYLYKKPKISIKKIRFSFLRLRNPKNDEELLATCFSCNGLAAGGCLGTPASCSL